MSMIRSMSQMKEIPARPVFKQNPSHFEMESEHGYFILVNVPGFEKSEITVEMSERKGELAIIAEKPGRLEDRIHYWVFAVPHHAVMSRASMRLRDGVLEVVLPKLQAVGAA